MICAPSGRPGGTGAIVVGEDPQVFVLEPFVPDVEADEVREELRLQNELGLASKPGPVCAEGGRASGRREPAAIRIRPDASLLFAMGAAQSRWRCAAAGIAMVGFSMNQQIPLATSAQILDQRGRAENTVLAFEMVEIFDIVGITKRGRGPGSSVSCARLKVPHGGAQCT